MNKIIKVLLVLLFVSFGKVGVFAQTKPYSENDWSYFIVDVIKENCKTEVGVFQNLFYEQPLKKYEDVLTVVLQQSFDGGRSWVDMSSYPYAVKAVFTHKKGLDPQGLPHLYQVASFPNVENGLYRVVLRNKEASISDAVQLTTLFEESFEVADVYSSINDFAVTEIVAPSMQDCNTEATDGSFKVTINHANLLNLKGDFLIVAKKGTDVIKERVSAFNENGQKLSQSVKVINGLSSGNWTVEVTDLAGGDVSCRATVSKEVQVPKGHNLDMPKDVYLFVKPDCTATDKYSSIFGIKYADVLLPNQVVRFTIKHERRENGVTKLIWDDTIMAGSVIDLATKKAEPSLYENGLRSDPNADLVFYQGASDLQEGDIVTISSDNLLCGGGSIRREFVVKNPFKDKKIIPTTANELSGACDGTVKALQMGVYVDQYYSELNNLVFSRLCDGGELAMHVRQKTTAGYVGNGTNALVENLSLKAYNPWKTISSTVKVTENGTYRLLLYSRQKDNANANTPYNAVSDDFNVTTINSKGFSSGEGALADVQIQHKKASVLEGRYGILEFSNFNDQIMYTKENPLTISIYPSSLREGSKQTVTFGATGPSTLATEGNVYSIDFPVVIKLERASNFSVADLPAGSYRIEMNDGCSKRTEMFVIPDAPAKIDVVSNVMKVCDNKADVQYTITTTNIDYWLNNFVADLFKDSAPNNDSIALSRRFTGNVVSKAKQTVKGNRVELVFDDLSPGDYIVRINSIYQDVISPVKEAFKGYMAGESGEDMVSNKNWNNKTYFYYKLRLVPPTENSLVVTPIKCNDEQVSISVDAGSNVLNYPITYTLYSADLVAGMVENEQVAVDATGVPVQSFTLRSEQQSKSTLYSFTNLPKLEADKVYIVRYTNACAAHDYLVDKIEELKTQVKVSSTELCAGQDLTLDVNLPENIYNIEWKSDAANVPSSVARKKQATLQPRVTAKYWAEYSIKAVTNCTNTRFETPKVEVTVVDDGQAPRLGLLSNTNRGVIEKQLTPGLCDYSYEWERVVFEDSCLDSVTWKVLSAADGSVIHTPATDPLTGNSIGNSWEFPLGESKVVYTARDVSGKVTEHSFTVNVLPTTLSLNTNNTYVDDTGAILSTVKIGGKLNYKVTLNNNTQKNVKDVVITVSMPDNNGVELPSVGDVDISSLQTTALKATVATVTRPDNKNVYVIQNIDPTIFVAGSGERAILFPMSIKEDCEGFSDACAAVLNSKVTVAFKGEVNCPRVGQVTEIKDVSLAINTDDCVHRELLCTDSQIELHSDGDGFTAWQWYLNDVALPNATSDHYDATQAGKYTVKRKANCNGQEIESSQIIQVYSKAPQGVSEEGADPIRAVAEVGAYCSTDFVWTSHFYLCEGSTRELEVDYHTASRVVWERYSGQETGTCLPRLTGWAAVSENRHYTLSVAGSYRLRIEANGCSDVYYFDVFTAGIDGTIVTNNITDTGSGSIDITMRTTDIPYVYKLIDGNNITIVEKSFDEGADRTSRHIFPVQGIESGGSKTYTVEVSSPSLKGCVYKQDVTVSNTSTIRATVSNVRWSSVGCMADFDFELLGGTSPYRVAIYSIDGKKVHKDDATGVDLALVDIPEEFFKTPVAANGLASTARSFTLSFPIEVLKGKYSFVVKDRDGAKIIETNTVDIPTSSDDFSYQIEYNNAISADNLADASVIKVTPDNGVLEGKYELWHVNADGTAERIATNTGTFLNISAGNYEIRYRTGGGCTLKKPLVVEKQTSGLRAHVGIKIHNSCDTDRQNRAFTAVINNVTGGSGNYEYAFTGDVFGASPEGKVYSSGTVKVRDKVTNARLELPITVPSILQAPTWIPNPSQEIVYDCEGNAILTPRITAPVDNTYNYTYEYFDSHIGKTVRTAVGTEKLLLRPKSSDSGTGSGRSDGQKITVYYEDTVAKVINNLFTEDFGTGYNDCLVETTNGIDFSPVQFTCASEMVRGLSSSGSYMVTKQLPASTLFSSPASADQGRYLAVATSAVSNVLYERPIKGVQALNNEGTLQKIVKVSLKYASILPEGSTKASSPVIVELVTPTKTYSKRFDALSNGTVSWRETGEMSFDLTADPIATNAALQLRIRGGLNSGVALDDIKVYQTVPSCGQKIDVVIPVEAGHAFEADKNIIAISPSCPGGNDGMFIITMFNAGNKKLQGSIDRGRTWVPLVQNDSDKPESGSGATGQRLGAFYRFIGSDANPLKAGSYQLMIKSDDGCSYRFDEEAVMLDKEPVTVDTDHLIISPIGCEGNYKIATLMFPIKGGTHTANNSYSRLLWRFKGEGDDKWNLRRTGFPTYTEFSNTVGVVRATIPGLTYEFLVIDGPTSTETDAALVAKLCNKEPVFTYTVPMPTPIQVDIDHTVCYSGNSDGYIKVSVTQGAGGYQFSIDGGSSFVSASTESPNDQVFTNLDSGTYKLVVKDQYGCTLTDEQGREGIDVVIPELVSLLGNVSGDYSCSDTTPHETITFSIRGRQAKMEHSLLYRKGNFGEYKQMFARDMLTSIGKAVDGTDGAMKLVNFVPTIQQIESYLADPTNSLPPDVNVTFKIEADDVYFFKFRDENGCESEPLQYLIGPNKPEWSSGVVLEGSTISCAGEGVGYIRVNTGGTTPRRIDTARDVKHQKGISPFSIDVFKDAGAGVRGQKMLGQNNLPAGKYIVVIRDSKGCESDPKIVEVRENLPPDLSNVTTQGETCTTQGTQYGSVMYIISGGGTPPFRVSLHTETGAVARDVSSVGSSAYAIKENVSSGSSNTFGGLTAGKYTLRVFDRYGCKTEKVVNISGAVDKLRVEPQPTTNCNKASVKLTAYKSGNANINGNVGFAVYRGERLSDITPVQGTIVEENGKNVVTITIDDLEPGATYSYYVVNGGCRTIYTPSRYNTGEDAGIDKAMQTTSDLTTKVDVKGLAVCGTEKGKISFKLTDIPAGTTRIDYNIYRYPDGVLAGNGGIAIPVNGQREISYAEDNNSLDEGEYYVVFKHDGIGCVIASKPFTIATSGSPMSLHMEKLRDAASNDTACHSNSNLEGWLRIWTEGGEAPFKYIVSKNATVSASMWEKVTPIGSTFMQTDHRSHQVFDDATQTMVSLADINFEAATWYVHVQDALGCTASKDITVDTTQGAIVAKNAATGNALLTPGNLCVANGEYTLEVKMESIGSGLHTYELVGENNRSRSAITFQTGPDGKPYFVVPHLRSSKEPQYIIIRDSNDCYDKNTPTNDDGSLKGWEFKIPERITYTLEVSKQLSCMTGGAKNGYISIKGLQDNLDPNKTYSYRSALIRTALINSLNPQTGAEETNIVEIETNPRTGRISNPAEERIEVEAPGLYYVYVYEDGNADCPIKRQITVREPSIPVLKVINTKDEFCTNTPSIGVGEGVLGVTATGEGLAPFRFKIVSAVDLTTNTALNFEPRLYDITTQYAADGVTPIPVSSNTSEVYGDMAVFKGLKGTYAGVRYGIQAIANESISKCESNILYIDIRAPKPIVIDKKAVTVEQFTCEEGSLNINRGIIKVDPSKISGGAGNYTYLFKNLTTGRITTKKEPFYVFSDRRGGKFNVIIRDANGCDQVYSELKDPSRPYSLDNPHDSTKPITLEVKEYVAIEKIEVSQVLAATCNNLESVEIKVTTFPATPTVAPRFKYVIHSDDQRVTMGEDLEPTTETTKRFDGLRNTHFRIIVTNVDTGCEAIATYSVHDPNDATIEVEGEIKHVSCNGGNDGAVTLKYTDQNPNNGDLSRDGFTYEITNLNGVLITTGIVPSGTNIALVEGLRAGNYRVRATSVRTGCKTIAAANFSIQQAELPLEANATKLYDATCNNASGEIGLEIRNGKGPYDVTIYKDGNAMGNPIKVLGNTMLFEGLGGGNNAGEKSVYTFQVMDAWGCTQIVNPIEPVELERPFNIESDAIASPTSCRGTRTGKIEIDLTKTKGGSGNYFFSLEEVNGREVFPAQRSNVFDNLPAGEYIVRVTDRWQCGWDSQNANKTYIVTDAPEIIIEELDRSQSLCADEVEGGFVSFKVTGGVPNTLVTRYGGKAYNVELVSVESNIVKQYSYVNEGDKVTFDNLIPRRGYRIQVTDGAGCARHDPFNVEITSAPDLTTKSIQILKTCQNNSYRDELEVEFADARDSENIMYVLEDEPEENAVPFDRYNGVYAYIDNPKEKFGPGYKRLDIIYQNGTKTCKKTSLSFLVPDVQDLELIQSDKVRGLINQSMFVAQYGVPPYQFYFNGEPAPEECDEETHTIETVDHELVDGQCSNSAGYRISPSDPEIIKDGIVYKKVQVAVEDGIGCRREGEFLIMYSDIEIPLYFTPDGSNYQDTWGPENIRDYPKLTVTILDRYGRILKELKGNEKWDGNYEGKPMPTGDYWYIIQLNSDKDDREFKGHFTLFR